MRQKKGEPVQKKQRSRKIANLKNIPGKGLCVTVKKRGKKLDGPKNRILNNGPQ